MKDSVNTFDQQLTDNVSKAEIKMEVLGDQIDEGCKLRIRNHSCMTSGSIAEDSGGRNTRHGSVAQTREQFVHINQKDFVDQVDRVDRAFLVEHCGSRDDSLSWNLGRVKQGRNNPRRRRASTRLRTRQRIA